MLTMDRKPRRNDAPPLLSPEDLLDEARTQSTAPRPVIERVKVAALNLDPRVQTRVHINWSVVQQYAQDMRDLREQGKDPAEVFEPIRVFRGPAGDVVADGFHRAKAAQSCSELELRALVSPGGFEEALEFALGANRHGQPLSQADKKNAVLKALETWGEGRSTHWIADKTGVPQKTVWRWKEDWKVAKTGAGKSVTQEATQLGLSRELEPVEQPIEKVDRVLGKDGRSHPATKPKPKAELPPPATPAPAANEQAPTGRAGNPVFRSGDLVLVRAGERTGAVIAPNPYTVTRRTYHVRIYTKGRYSDKVLEDGEIEPNRAQYDRRAVLRNLLKEGGHDKAPAKLLKDALAEAEAAADKDRETLRVRAVGSLFNWCQDQVRAGLEPATLVSVLLQQVLAVPEGLSPAAQATVRKTLGK